jgi:hypothetical protein
VPVVDIVNPAIMRVRAKVNQADVNELRAGQAVRIGLDAYPALEFDGVVAQISPLAVTSSLSPKIRNFTALVDVHGSHPNLMPDLTASIDVELAREAGVLVVPRDAVRQEGGRATVQVRRGDRFETVQVTLGAMNRHEVVVTGGLEPGVAVRRNIAAGAGQRISHIAANERHQMSHAWRAGDAASESPPAEREVSPEPRRRRKRASEGRAPRGTT